MWGQGAFKKWGKFSLSALIWTLLKLLHNNIKLWGVGSLLLKGGLSTSWHPVSCNWDPPQSTGLNFLQSLNCVSKSFICKIFVLLILWQLSFFFACNRDRTSVVHFLYFHKTILLLAPTVLLDYLRPMKTIRPNSIPSIHIKLWRRPLQSIEDPI